MKSGNRNVVVNRSVIHDGSKLSNSRPGSRDNNSLPRDAILAAGPGDVKSTKNKDSRDMKDQLLAFGKKGNRPSALNLPTHNFAVSEIKINITGRERKQHSNDSRGYSEYEAFNHQREGI